MHSFGKAESSAAVTNLVHWSVQTCGGSGLSSQAMRILEALNHFSYPRSVPNHLLGHESDMLVQQIASAFADIQAQRRDENILA
jgi:hypothetical protein